MCLWLYKFVVNNQLLVPSIFNKNPFFTAIQTTGNQKVVTQYLLYSRSCIALKLSTT